MRLIPIKKLGASVLILSAFSAPAFAHDVTAKQVAAQMQRDHKEEICEERLEALVKVSLDDPDHFEGMTEVGLKRLTQAQGALKTTTVNANNAFEGLQGIFEAYYLGMATRHNVLLGGDPGGAKTASVEFLIPREQLWTKQMNEFLSPSNIFGGITQKGIEDGTMTRNRTGFATEFPYVLADELPNLNPAASGDMLSYMNPGERRHEGHDAVTRTVFSTGNATRAQILDMMKKNGLYTGPALLNRSVIKGWVTNWLTPNEMYRFQQNKRIRDHLKSIVLYGTPEQREEAKRRLNAMKAQKIDMEAIEAFAQHAFVPHEDLMTSLISFANEFRAEMTAWERKSEQTAKSKPNFNILVDTPSADWTTRFFGDLLRMIQFSAALDYLRMVGPEGLDFKHWGGKPKILTPMSLWRIMYMSTTVGPGENRFSPVTMEIDYNLRKNLASELEPADHKYELDGCKNETSEGELQFMWKEQELTNRILKNITGTLAVSAKELAEFMPDPTEDQRLNLDRRKVDFEIENAVYLGRVRRLSEKVEKERQERAAAEQAAQQPPAPPQ